MSAFIVSHDHIDALLTFAKLHRVSYYVPQRLCNVPGGKRVDIDSDTVTEVGRILLDENERSVRHRYRDDSETAESAAYRFREFTEIMTLPAGKKCAWILNACRCYDYQACETDDYRESLAHRIIEEIQAAAIRALPHIEDAPWEIIRPVRSETAA